MHEFTLVLCVVKLSVSVCFSHSFTLCQVVLPVPYVHKFIIADTLEVNIMILQETILLKLHISINNLYLARVKVTKHWPLFHFKSTAL